MKPSFHGAARGGQFWYAMSCKSLMLGFRFAETLAIVRASFSVIVGALLADVGLGGGCSHFGTGCLGGRGNGRLPAHFGTGCIMCGFGCSGSGSFSILVSANISASVGWLSRLTMRK